jgi:exonuclease SbcD
MRILHTADWHFGRTLEGRSRLAEQEQFVDELCSVADDTNAQLIVVAGDIFDSANPPAAAEELFYETISRLSVPEKRAVLVIAGNHDNPERLCAAAPLATRQGAVLLGRPGEAPILGAQGGPGWCEFGLAGEQVQVVALPYPSEARLDEALSTAIDDEIRLRAAYSQRIQEVMAASAMSYRGDAVRIAVSHLFAAGGLESESERPIQVGGAFTVQPNAFPAAAQYVALGHLHRPQNLQSQHGHIRYSGSPLAYSFAEAGQTKSVTLVEATPSTLHWQEIHLSAGKPLVRWRATQGFAQVEEWCTEGRDRNAWVELEIHLETPLTPEEVARLKRMHPGLVIIRPIFSAQAQVAVASEDRIGLPVSELFRLFYANRRAGAVPAPETLDLFLELLEHASSESGQGEEVAE